MSKNMVHAEKAVKRSRRIFLFIDFQSVLYIFLVKNTNFLKKLCEEDEMVFRRIIIDRCRCKRSKKKF